MDGQEKSAKDEDCKESRKGSGKETESCPDTTLRMHADSGRNEVYSLRI